MRVVFMGTPDFAVVSLKKMLLEGFAVEMVVTQPDRPKGRGKRILPPPAKQTAQEAGIRVIQPESVKDQGFIAALRDIKPDVIVVVAFGQILPEGILNLPPLGCVNVHASLLPKYRGAAPINWCIIKGEILTGVTTMYMDKGMDTGDMIYRKETDIGLYESAGQLHDRLAVLGSQALVRTLRDIERGTAPRIPQNHAEATYAPQLRREDGAVDWCRPAAEIFNLVRGMDPWPGSYTFYRGERLKIWQVKTIEGESGKDPGTILQADRAGLRVQTGYGQILIEELQMPSSRRMTVDEYVRGNVVTPGETLGD